MNNPNEKFIQNLSPEAAADLEKAKAMLGSEDLGASGNDVAELDLRTLPESNIDELVARVREAGDGTAGDNTTIH